MKQIEIGGKLRPVLYGINALSDFNEGTNTTLEWIFKMMAKPLSMNFNQVRWLVYVGLKQGAEENGLDVDFDVLQVGKWLDVDFKKFQEFIVALQESMSKSDDSKKK